MCLGGNFVFASLYKTMLETFPPRKLKVKSRLLNNQSNRTGKPEKFQVRAVRTDYSQKCQSVCPKIILTILKDGSMSTSFTLLTLITKTKSATEKLDNFGSPKPKS